jgi:hypothetical protein
MVFVAVGDAAISDDRACVVEVVGCTGEGLHADIRGAADDGNPADNRIAQEEAEGGTDEGIDAIFGQDGLAGQQCRFLELPALDGSGSGANQPPHGRACLLLEAFHGRYDLAESIMVITPNR